MLYYVFNVNSLLKEAFKQSAFTSYCSSNKPYVTLSSTTSMLTLLALAINRTRQCIYGLLRRSNVNLLRLFERKKNVSTLTKIQPSYEFVSNDLKMMIIILIGLWRIIVMTIMSKQTNPWHTEDVPLLSARRAVSELTLPVGSMTPDKPGIKTSYSELSS